VPVIAAALSGCDAGICTTSVEPGVEVEVRDAVTGQYLIPNPRGVVQEGTFQDSLEAWSYTADVPPRIISLSGAHERPGRYVIQIEAEGYLPWDTARVRVEDGDCHVQTVRFIAALQPAP
jgi:hypothetical protein